MPDGVIGNTADFDSAIPGSSPGRVIFPDWKLICV